MITNTSSSVEMRRSSMLLSGDTIQHGFIEKLLLTLVAAMGIVGSLFIISQSASGNQGPVVPESHLMASGLASTDTNPIEGKDFSDIIGIEGEFRAGSRLQFTFDRDALPKGHRYMMDMGDGMRIILTRDKFSYTYEKSGEYNIELRGVKNAVVKVFASEVLTID